MGGNFATNEPEHNLLCDVTAAQAVFAAGVPAVLTAIDQTERVVLTDAQLGSIEAAGALGSCSSPRSVSSVGGSVVPTVRTIRWPYSPWFALSSARSPVAGSA